MPLVFLLYACFASVFTIGKTGLEYAQPFFLVGTRMCFAGILMLLYIAFTRPKQLKVSKKQLWFAFKLAVFNIYLTNTFEFWGLKYLTTFKACFIYSLSPFIAALFSFFIFSEKLPIKKWMGLLIGFLGMVPILFTQGAAEVEIGSFLFFSWPELALLTACITSVYGWIVLKQLVGEHQCSPLMANGLSMVMGGVFALMHSAVTEDWNPVPVTEMVPFIECTLVLIVISNIVCYNLYGYLLKRHSATFMSFAGNTTPLFTALFGWFFLGEVITWQFYLSMGIITLALYTFNSEKLKRVPEAA